MNMFDLLTDKDYELIDKYITAYAGPDGSPLPSHADVKTLLYFWNGAKDGFLSTLFDNQLILERHIKVAAPESIIWKQLEEIVYPGDQTIEFVKNFNNWSRPLHWKIYDLVSKLVSIDTLATNIYDGESFELSIPDKDHPLQINKGCKVMKILGKMAKIFNIEGFEDFRLKHSRVLNQKSFEGTLCLSIHPLDYMTMSDNECGWDSCMSWRKPGEVRAGTVEMMNSPYVIVAYLKAEKDMKLFKNEPQYTWNNKRWRELFVVSPDIVTGIKGYPYCDNILEGETFKWLMELIHQNHPWCDHEGPIVYEADECFDFHGEEVQINYIFEVMYDDFYSDHTGYFSPSILEKLDKYDRYSIKVSGATMCLECGEEWYGDASEWNSMNLICPHCTGEMKCSHCGEFYRVDNLTQMSNDDYLCEGCLEYYTRYCHYCEEYHYREDSNTIYMAEDGRIDSCEMFHLCDDCLETVEKNNYYGPIEDIERPGVWYSARTVSAIDIDKLTLEGFRAFGYYAETVEAARKMV